MQKINSMKNYSLFIILLLLVLSCTKKEEKLELFSPEAFAYSIEDGWELNASCRVKGFAQRLINNLFYAKLSYNVDIKTPDGKLLSNVDEGLIDQNSSEKFSDLSINSQIQFDSSYSEGNYEIIFNVSDDLSGRVASIKKEFVLSK